MGHIAAHCGKTNPRCPRGCPRAHPAGVRECPKVRPDDWYCINCRTKGHSAAYAGCPARKKLQQAHELKATQYMPLSVAMKACSNKPRRRSSTPVDEERANKAYENGPLSWAQRVQKASSAGTLKSSYSRPEPPSRPRVMHPPNLRIDEYPSTRPSGTGGLLTGSTQSGVQSYTAQLRPGGQRSTDRRPWGLGASLGAGKRDGPSSETTTPQPDMSTAPIDDKTVHAKGNADSKNLPASSQSDVGKEIQVLSNLINSLNSKLEKMEQKFESNIGKIHKDVKDIKDERKKQIQTASDIVDSCKTNDVVSQMALDVIKSLVDTAKTGDSRALMKVLYNFAPRDSIISLPHPPQMSAELQSALFNVMGYSVEKKHG